MFSVNAFSETDSEFDIQVKNEDGIDIYYKFIKDGQELSVSRNGYGRYTGDIRIPSTVIYDNKYYNVTAIDDNAFKHCEKLKSVTIGNNVTSIGKSAFYYCNGLTTLTIGNSVKHIGESAFLNCSGLTTLNFPNSVTDIGESAFSGCKGLNSVTIGNSITSIGDFAFSSCIGLTSVSIEDGTETLLFSISDGAAYSNHFASCPIKKLYLGRNYNISLARSPFKGNQQLTSVTFGNSVTTIGDNAFYGCSGITTLNIPNSVTTIGSSAFRECKGLNSVTIGNNVTSIGDNAFYGCSGITILNIPNSIILIRENAFSGCSGLTTLNIPNSVTTIGKSAFCLCKGLNSVTIEDGTETLSFDNTSNGYPFSSCPIEKLYLGRNISYSPSYSPFRGNQQLTSVIIGNNVTSIGESAFNGCRGLTALNIPNSVTTIGKSAFSGCKGLNSVTIEDGTETLLFSSTSRDNPFSSCPIEKLYLGRNIRYSSSYSPFGGNQQLTSVAIGNSVTTIWENAFSGCSGLTTLNIPNSVTTIGSSTFSGCNGLNSVTIGNNVSSIGDNAFYGCSGITTLNIPNSVTTIGSSAFRECKGLNSVTIGNDVTSIGDNAFYGCSGITTLNIPNSVTSIGSSTFSGCNGLNSVTIGNNVSSIGDNAFYGCSGITTLNIPNSVTTIGSSAFRECKGLNSVTIEDGTETLLFSSTSSGNPFSSCPIEKLYLGRNISYSPSYSPFCRNQHLTSVLIGNNVTSIGENAFSVCKGLKSVSLPNDILSIGNNAFDENTKLYVNKVSKTLLTFWNKNKKGKCYTPYDKTSDEEILPPSFFIATTTQTTASVEIENWCDGFTYKYNGEETTKKMFNYTKLKPELTQKLTLVVEKDDVHYDVTGSFTTKSLSPRIETWESTASSIEAKGAYTEEDAKVVAHNIRIGDLEGHEGNEIFAYGLNPGRNYTVNYSIEVDYGGEETATYTGTSTISTQRLQVSMAQPKVVSAGNVIVSATTNLYEDENNVGFEWRCTDWTDEFPSNTGTAYLYDGTIEGNIKNLNTDKLWKCRPYYLSDAGVYNYGDWMGIDPTNTSYFEPTVHTYSKVTIKGNTALIRGYALSGTDEVKVQGFKYWKTKGGSGHLNKVVAVPSNALTVELSNKQQTLTTTLSNLEYDSEYCCVAFVTTTDGNTFYGEEQKFITGESPSEIECVETESDTDESLIEVARYNVNGQKIDAPQKGVNIIRYSDGTTKSVYVK